MALLNKLFNNRRKNCKLQTKTSEFFDSPRCETPKFSKDEIRVLVFRECERRGRKLLFDWKSMKKTEPVLQEQGPSCKLPFQKGSKQSLSHEKIEGYTEVASNGITYQYLRPRSDVKMLGEMIFGSVAMSYKGVAIKIHNIRSPPQLMFSKVFPAPGISAMDSDRESDGPNSLQNSMSECCPIRGSPTKTSGSIAHSVPVDVPAPTLQIEDDLESMAPSSLRSNGSFSSVRSFQRSPEGSTSSLSSLTRSGSFNSLHRRWLRTITTNMEYGLKRMSEDSLSRADRLYPSNRRTKLAISVVISLSNKEEDERDFQNFFFSHITLIEGYINKLSIAVEKAYVNRRQFVHLVMVGVECLQQALYDLYTAPRFPEPVWLSMMNPGAQQHVLCLRFITELMNLLEQYESRTTNFFVSTLLTAVLTHHLAWVPTVTPPGILPSQSFHEKHKAKWLDILAKLHPYNPLWIQLGDIYGALGFPSKMAKTVIVGRDSDLVKRIMYCLTYFIRCSEVYENVETRVPVSRHNAMSASSTSSSSGSTVTGESSHCQQLQDQTSSTPLLDVLRQDSSEGKGLPRRLLSLPDFQAINPCLKRRSSEVERQEGEGDEEEDDVFSGEKAQLRTGRQLSTAEKSHRHGVIFEVAESVNVAEVGIYGEVRPTKEEKQCLLRDSGINSYVEADEGARVGIVLNSIQNKGSLANKSKRRPSNGKVFFTIGNIPLEEICSPIRKGEREPSPVDDVLVCTCGKHIPGVNKENNFIPESKSKMSANSDCQSDEHKPPKLSLSSVNAKLIRLHNNSVPDAPDCTRADLSMGSSKTSSIACDSGIHSCEDSRADFMDGRTTSTQTNAVQVLKFNSPKVRLEHVRNVGKSRGNEQVLLCREKLTDFIGIPEPDAQHGNTKQSELVAAAPVSPLKLNSCQRHNASNGHRQHFDYERTNSMFDEYFDENVELKMLDEQTFQERLKQTRTLENGGVNTKPLSSDTESDCKCRVSGGKCESRDSLLDGQDGGHACSCDSLSTSSISWQQSGHADKRSIMWNNRVSSIDSCNSEDVDFFDRVTELPMPKSQIKQSPLLGVNETCRGFGWSLMPNYMDHYMSDFALQGTCESTFGDALLSDLKMTVQNPILEEEVSEAICIVANTNNWTVELISSRNGAVTSEGEPKGIRVTTSQLVAGMTDSLIYFWKLKMSPEFCLLHLEDRLQEFYFKSRLLAEYFLDAQPSDIQKVALDLGVDTSDLPFLFAISSIHSPEITYSYGTSYR